MTTKNSSELLNKDTKPETSRQRKVRKNLDAGPIAARVPPEREGFHQHVVVDKDGKVERALEDLGYDYRSGPDGKPLKFHGHNNEQFYVLECPEDMWNAELKRRHKVADEGIEALKRKRTFGTNNMQFDGEAVMTRGSMDVRDKNHFGD
jgi:hypothetical protein